MRLSDSSTWRNPDGSFRWRKIVLNFPSVANNDFYEEEVHYAYAYAHDVAELHCSEYGKTSKLENESTNEGLTVLSFGCIIHWCYALKWSRKLKCEFFHNSKIYNY